MKKIRRSGPKGFTLVEIMIVVAIIALLAAVAIPNLVSARSRSQATACINNLRQIDYAIQTFAMEAGKAPGSVITFPSDLTPYIKMNVNGSIPSCPAGGTYDPTLVGNIPSVQCSLSTTVDPPHILQ